MVCTGIIKKKTAIPARHDGPIACNNNTITNAAWRGPIHKKCKYNVTCKNHIQIYCKGKGSEVIYNTCKSKKRLNPKGFQEERI